MELNNLEQRLAALPERAQREVADLIATLEARHRRSRTASTAALRKEPFIGCWRDRDDLADSTAWVRHTRRSEWGTPDA